MQAPARKRGPGGDSGPGLGRRGFLSAGGGILAGGGWGRSPTAGGAWGWSSHGRIAVNHSSPQERFIVR